MSRPVADDVIAVLQEVRAGFHPSELEPDAKQLRLESVLTIARSELDAGRFANMTSAEHSIQDACVRRLGYGGVAEFDLQVANWLQGRPYNLSARIFTKATTESQQRRVAEVLGAFDPRLAIPKAFESNDSNLQPAVRVETTISRIRRDAGLSRYVKSLYDYECQICGLTIHLPGGSRYAEGHHVRPLGEPDRGYDVVQNIICLCPNHHVQCDLGVIKIDRDHLRIAADHDLNLMYIEYHNNEIYGRIRRFRPDVVDD